MNYFTSEHVSGESPEKVKIVALARENANQKANFATGIPESESKEQQYKVRKLYEPEQNPIGEKQVWGARKVKKYDTRCNRKEIRNDSNL